MKKRLISILMVGLLVLLVFPFNTIPVSADTTVLQDGDLLYEVDFNDSNWGFVSKGDLRTPDIEVSPDGSSVTVMGSAGSGYYWGGEIPDMPLKDNRYTIEFSITRSTNEGSGCAGVHAFNDTQILNGNGVTSYGFYTFSSRQMYAVQYQVGNRDFGPVGYGFTTYPVKDTVIDQDGKATQYFKYEINGDSGVISCYMKSNGSYKYVGATPVLNFGTENLSIMLFTYGQDIFVKLNDVKIYKGLLAGNGITPEENGELLLQISDLTQSATGAQGATYTQSISNSSADIATYSYNTSEGAMISAVKNGIAGTQVYGGLTNLSLNARSKYTVTYQTKLPVGAGTGLRVSSNGSYGSSAGFYDSIGNKGCITFGPSPNGYAPYIDYADSMKQDGSIYSDNGYNNVAIEIDGYKITAYINGIKFITGDVGKPLNAVYGYGYSSDVLALVIHDYYVVTNPGTVKSITKNIKVYSGLIMSGSSENQAENTTENAVDDTEALTINGNSITNYKIVYNSKLIYSKEAANSVRDIILNKTGVSLTIVPDTEPESSYEILVGNTSRQESREVYMAYDRPNVYYTIKTAGNKLLIVNQGKMSGDKAIAAFESYINGLTTNDITASLNLSGDCKAEAFASSHVDTDLRVMQSNLLFTEAVNGFSYQQRAELVADIYLATLPDIVTFNEFVNDISYRIADLIKDYYTIDKAPFENAYDFSEIEDPRLGAFHGTPIAYRTDKYAVIDSGFRLYGGERNYVHQLTWGLYKDLNTGHIFLVSSNHYGDQAMASGGKFTSYAEQTINRVNEVLEKYGEIPVILCGDWFFKKNEAPYNYIIQNGYVDATDNAQIKNSAGIGTYHTIGVGETNRIIEDLLFYETNSTTALTHRVYVNFNSIQSSDHYPVIVDFKFDTNVVFYNANGGTGAPVAQMKYNDTNLTLTSNIPTRAGYYFDGWDTNIAGTTRVYYPKQTYTANQNATLYAVWKEIVPATISDGPYFISNNTDVTNISIANTDDGTQFKTAVKGTINSSEQIFLFEWQSDGTYKVTNVFSGKVMENKDGADVLGNPVAQNTSNDAVAQRWWIVENGMKYNLINADSGLFLDISSSSTSPGSNLLMWYNSGSANGLNFTLNPTGAFLLSYNANGGTGTPASQIKYNDTNLILTGNIPTRAGYYFDGWDTNIAGTTRVYYPKQTYTANQNATLYAVWKEIVPATISDGSYFISNNTDVTNISIANTDDGTQFKTAIKGTINSSEQIFLFERQSDGTYKITNVFSGKVMENKDGADILGNPVAQNTSNDTAAQRWWIVENGTKYNLINADSGLFLDLSSSSTSPGYNLLMWYNSGSANGLNFTLNPTGAFLLSYNANGGTGTPASQIKYNDTNLILTGNIPTRAGYYFDGWDTNIAGTTRVYYPKQAYTADQNATLYAVWKKIIPKTISNGNYFISNNTNVTNISIANTDDGTQFKTAAKGTINSSEQIFLFERQSDGTYMITNVYSGKVMENKNGADVLDNPVAQNTSNDTVAQRWWIVENGTKYNLINADSGLFLDISSSSTLPGSNLLMWYNSGSANGLNFTLNPTGALVSYNANGGMGAPASQIKYNGTNLTLTSNIPTRTGYFFDGWDTNSAGTTRVYYPKQTYTANQNATLYAVWKEIIPTTISNGNYFISNNTDVTNISIVNTDDGTQFKTAVKGTINSSEQIFLFERQSDGTYKITNLFSGKVMENKNGANVLANPVAQNTSNDTAAQRWWIVASGTKYNLINADSGLFLDISSSSTSPGYNLLMWYNSGSANGLNFTLSKIVPKPDIVLMEAGNTVLKSDGQTVLKVTGAKTNGSIVDLSQVQVSFTSSDISVADAVYDKTEVGYVYGKVLAKKEGTAVINALVILDGKTVISNEIAITVDGTPPVTVETVSGAIYSDVTYNSYVVITLAAVDAAGGSEVAKTEYCFDSINWLVYTVPVTLTDNGLYNFSYKSVDNAGNVEAVKSISIKITMTPDVMTSYLITKVGGMGIDQGISNSLVSNLDNVVKSIMNGDNNSVINRLNAFINEVSAQSGKKLTVEQANELTTAANKIISVSNKDNQ